jgi:acyl-CoA synthetase (AMP-forming)/AMP-acid ligase II
VPSGDHDEQVAAVVVASEGSVIEVEALQAAVRAQLSSFKVPGIVLVLEADAVPWLATGKPDKRAMRLLVPPA